MQAGGCCLSQVQVSFESLLLLTHNGKHSTTDLVQDIDYLSRDSYRILSLEGGGGELPKPDVGHAKDAVIIEGSGGMLLQLKIRTATCIIWLML